MFDRVVQFKRRGYIKPPGRFECISRRDVALVSDLKIMTVISIKPVYPPTIRERKHSSPPRASLVFFIRISRDLLLFSSIFFLVFL